MRTPDEILHDADWSRMNLNGYADQSPLTGLIKDEANAMFQAVKELAAVKWFVYFDCGSCNCGDHSSGLEQFDTEEAATAFIEKNAAHWVVTYGNWTLIRGAIVKESP